MGNPTSIQEYIIWPIERAWGSWRYKICISVLERHGLDFGQYPMEELCQMYQKHKDEINRE